MIKRMNIKKTRKKQYIMVFFISLVFIGVAQYILFSKGLIGPFYDALTIDYNEELVVYAGEEIKVLPKRKIFPTYAMVKALAWSTDNPEVLSVDENGILKGLNVGKGKVHISTEKGKATLLINVRPVINVSVSEGNVGLEVGQEMKLNANIDIFPENASLPEVIYKVSGQGGVLEVTKEGVIKAIAPGSEDIIISCGDANTVVNVTVHPEVRVVEFSAGETERYIRVGETIKLQFNIVTEPKGVEPPKISYRNINPIKLIEIHDDGSITGLKKGRNVIEITCGDEIIFMKINVKEKK